MGQKKAGESKARTKLTLSRETLKELTPESRRAVAVKGGMPMLPLPSRWSKCKCWA